ncbi:long-chain fatty acid--CoA ligase [Rhodococcus sp. ARC_M6]|uniref:acyl-CoA synthetase n=1 Tax=Rhodococcus sp. ARC_M6 TaxID=2928852 RepID=UPI001FB1B309|nr:long-chain fatty acid--CoA ligase [Rhodococcus sp. ARC_M6]MCJ0907497.1 long-chain fatty acid--CoA ligase [Rhodococcus sp. ARC_M6]
MHLTQPLQRALRMRPDEPMTICGDQVRTTREIGDRVARLGGALRQLGVVEGDRVGILAMNSSMYHETLYATWWVGAVSHGVNTRWSTAEIVYSLVDAGTKVLFIDDSFLAIVPKLCADAPSLKTVVYCGNRATPEGCLGYEQLILASDPIEDVRMGGQQPAVLFYTGGTTGAPKGVLLSHQGVMTSTFGGQVAHNAARQEGVTLVSAPLFHIAALGSWNAQNLVGGAQLFVPSFQPEAVLAAIEKHRVTTMMLVPTMLQMLVDHPERDLYDLTSVRTVGYGASPMSQAVLERVMSAFPESEFYQGYGMTETGMITILGKQDHVGEGARLRSAGRSTPHFEIRIVDANDEDVSAGSVGEIICRGDSLMLGYWNLPTETAAVLRDGWMYTGDMGYLDKGGYVYVVDRAKDMIITGGENVYSAEVENAVAAHPSVTACAVVGVPDSYWGERVHAVVVLKVATAADETEIREFVRTRIAGYKVPRSVEFIDQLPLTASGKVLKRTLRERHMDNLAQAESSSTTDFDNRAVGGESTHA